MSHDSGYIGYNARHIMMACQECIFLAVDFHIITVYFSNHDAAAPKGSSHNGDLCTVYAFRINFCYIGMPCNFIGKGECNIDSLLLCRFKRSPYDFAVRRIAHKAGRQSAVRTVALSCLCKRAVQSNVRFLQWFSQDAAGDQAYARCSCRVRTRRTNHDWSDNIKNTHVSPFFEKKKSAVSSRSPLTS